MSDKSVSVERWKVDENELAGYGDNGPNFYIVPEGGDRWDPIAVLSFEHKKMDYGESPAYLQAKDRARLIAAAPELLEALQKIADESVFNQLRYAEDTETDYFLRCFRAVKEAARAAIAKATGTP